MLCVHGYKGEDYSGALGEGVGAAFASLAWACSSSEPAGRGLVGADERRAKHHGAHASASQGAERTFFLFFVVNDICVRAV